MSYIKILRKKFKSTFFYNVIQNWLHKPLKSFSDCFGEDLFVFNYFSDLNKGFYIDIGCNQPKINSLTFLLHKKGWKGMNFDISERCIKLYKFFRSNDFNLNEYKKFLQEIGYLEEVPADFTITTRNTDPEISSIPGPQLVVPIMNARFALNATNARCMVNH